MAIARLGRSKQPETRVVVPDGLMLPIPTPYTPQSPEHDMKRNSVNEECAAGRGG
jgi:hypothetical protein